MDFKSVATRFIAILAVTAIFGMKANEISTSSGPTIVATSPSPATFSDAR